MADMMRREGMLMNEELEEREGAAAQEAQAEIARKVHSKEEQVAAWDASQRAELPRMLIDGYLEPLLSIRGRAEDTLVAACEATRREAADERIRLFGRLSALLQGQDGAARASYSARWGETEMLAADCITEILRETVGAGNVRASMEPHAAGVPVKAAIGACVKTLERHGMITPDALEMQLQRLADDLADERQEQADEERDNRTGHGSKSDEDAEKDEENASVSTRTAARRRNPASLTISVDDMLSLFAAAAFPTVFRTSAAGNWEPREKGGRNVWVMRQRYSAPSRRALLTGLAQCSRVSVSVVAINDELALASKGGQTIDTSDIERAAQTAHQAEPDTSRHVDTRVVQQGHSKPAELSCMTVIEAPTAPTLSLKGVLSNGFSVEWSAPVDDGGNSINSYSIEYELEANTDVVAMSGVKSTAWRKVRRMKRSIGLFAKLSKGASPKGSEECGSATVKGSARAHTVRGLRPGARYTVRIRAVGKSIQARTFAAGGPMERQAESSVERWAEGIWSIKLVLSTAALKPSAPLLRPGEAASDTVEVHWSSAVGNGEAIVAYEAEMVRLGYASDVADAEATKAALQLQEQTAERDAVQAQHAECAATLERAEAAYDALVGGAVCARLGELSLAVECVSSAIDTVLEASLRDAEAGEAVVLCRGIVVELVADVAQQRDFLAENFDVGINPRQDPQAYFEELQAAKARDKEESLRRFWAESRAAHEARSDELKTCEAGVRAALAEQQRLQEKHENDAEEAQALGDRYRSPIPLFGTKARVTIEQRNTFSTLAVVPAARYCVRIRAQNAVGAGPWAELVCETNARAGVPPQPLLPPAVTQLESPLLLAAGDSKAGVTLTWLPPPRFADPRSGASWMDERPVLGWELAFATKLPANTHKDPAKCEVQQQQQLNSYVREFALKHADGTKMVLEPGTVLTYRVRAANSDGLGEDPCC